MKRLFFIVFLFSYYLSGAQSVFGYWYGNANVKTNSSANNYLAEMILQPEKNYVKGILNYYFKNSYRSIKVQGDYSPSTRQLRLYDIPVVYYGSLNTLEVDCNMNLFATLRVSQLGSNLVGFFRAGDDYKYTCPDIAFNFSFNSDISKTDSVMKAISEFKENYQVWQPAKEDTLVAVTVIPRKVINYVTEKEYTERQNVVQQEIEVESDSLLLNIYDNGEIDGDMVSIFYNQKLILFNQKLTHKSIKMNLVLDSSLQVNEISMFAENLGLIPPNTALLILDDGKNQYQIRVSSSLEKNATIRIKRKKDSIKAKAVN
ncbi:MAG TPA: hypothetical protein VFV31_01445 [Chitinophagaceae bacterium]|nr:hypothetical protein [Chitinophagaceae bacterium]